MGTIKDKYKMDGVMSENGFPAPGEAELRNIFAASCVESAADQEGISAAEMFDLRQARDAFSYKKFDNYDVEWLEHIVANRRGEYDGDLYDIVEGGVANDRVIDTVEAYMSDMMPLETALRNLSMHRPNNQLCIRSQHVVDQFLTFVESYKI